MNKIIRPMIRQLLAFVMTILTAMMISLPAFAVPKFVETYTDWHVYVADTKAGKICFALSIPKDTKPDNVRRGDIFFMVTDRPYAKIQNEISMIVGYPYKPGAMVTVTIGSDDFNMVTQDDMAWAETLDGETKLVEAMKRGADMVIKGTSRRGTLTADSYSLSGITAALDQVDKECD